MPPGAAESANAVSASLEQTRCRSTRSATTLGRDRSGLHAATTVSAPTATSSQSCADACRDRRAARVGSSAVRSDAGGRSTNSARSEPGPVAIEPVATSSRIPIRVRPAASSGRTGPAHPAALASGARSVAVRAEARSRAAAGGSSTAQRCACSFEWPPLNHRRAQRCDAGHKDVGEIFTTGRVALAFVPRIGLSLSLKRMGPATCWQQMTGYPTRSVEAPGFRNLRRRKEQKGFDFTNP